MSRYKNRDDLMTFHLRYILMLSFLVILGILIGVNEGREEGIELTHKNYLSCAKEFKTIDGIFTCAKGK